MTDEQTIASEVTAFNLENLCTYTRRGEGAVEKWLVDYAPDVTFIPIGEQEVQGLDALETFVRREFELHPAPIAFDVLWTKVKVLRATLAVFEMATTMHLSETVTMPLRSTCVCEKRQGRWQIVHLHGSLPSRTAPDELWPVDVLRARNEELERLVAERTAELETAHREAQIEAALERVRARAMAMHRSEELREVVAVVFEELTRLDFALMRCSISIVDPDTLTTRYWMANSENATRPDSFYVKYHDHPAHRAFIAGWKERNPRWIYDLHGEIKTSWDDFLFTETEMAQLPAYVQAGMRAPDRVILSASFSSFGGLFMGTLEPLSEANLDILRRFGRVFDMTYTRFDDLQQAEARAREAQVEAALERIRARTMAMHHSEELLEVVAVVFREMQHLGFEPSMVSIGLFDAATSDSVWWQSDESLNALPRGYHVPYFDHPCWERIVETWRQRVSFASFELAGEAKQSFDALFFEETDFKNLPEANTAMMRGAAHTMLSYASTSHGVLEVMTEEPLPDEKAAILQRVASVIDLTYTRVDDLQQAEARAREATRQASLDRVRAEIASMRTAADLERITPLVWRELTALGVPFFRCGVFIIDEAEERVHTYLTTPEGRSIAVLHLSFDSAETTRAAVAHWRNRQVYTDLWDRQQFIAWSQAMVEQGHIDAREAYQGGEAPPETLALQFVPFTQGMLYVGSAESLTEEQIDLVQVLADAFAVAYARYEDFTNLEAAKARAEAALSDLKATQAQLIHAEKMASLGQMTAGIAHEIKNPLNFVNNFAELNEELAGELADELDRLDTHLPADLAGDFRAVLADMKGNAAQIAKHGRRADDIVRSMMQHARDGTGVRTPVAINALVEEYVKLAYHGRRASTPGFAVEIERAYSEAVGQAPVMSQEFGRVLMNLLSNAFDAVHEHAARCDGAYHPTVTVATALGDAGIEIRIADNGPGIPQSLQDRIFEPFYTTKPTGSGTGLGLSLSYDIVTQGHGGTLTVDSTEGGGATFTITIPVSTPTTPPPP